MKKTMLMLLLALGTLCCTKEVKDPCAGKTCENGGNCFDGSCNCVGLWKGEHCTEQITPILLTVGSVQITEMPPTDTNGAGWDISSGPDVYVVVKQNGTVLLNTSDSWVQNATKGVLWNEGFSTNFAVAPVTVEVWDHDDLDADDYMGGITGPLYFSTNNFPTSVILQCGICTVEVKFGLMQYL